MVIFGGLELVAAGYLLHEHSKHKEERARLEEEEAALERRRRRRRHSADRRRHHSQERKHSYYEYEDAKPARPQYLAPPTYPAASPYLAPTPQPARANSAPPPQQQQQQQQQQDPNYPPTGWPAHWAQSQTPDPNVAPERREAGPLPVKYGWRSDQDHVDSNAYSNPQYSPTPSSSRRSRSRGRSETRPSPAMSGARPVVRNPPPVSSPHVRFALPSDRSDPPPAYSR